jgi:hypothetical protein
MWSEIAVENPRLRRDQLGLHRDPFARREGFEVFDQKTLSNSTERTPVASLSRRAKVDLPAAPGPG